MKPRKIILLIPILLLACSLFTGLPSPTPTRTPPTGTATSSPSPTIPPLPSRTPTYSPTLAPAEPVLDLSLQEAAMLPAFVDDV